VGSTVRYGGYEQHELSFNYKCVDFKLLLSDDTLNMAAPVTEGIKEGQRVAIRCLLSEGVRTGEIYG
jgi:hypothetical protein